MLRTLPAIRGSRFEFCNPRTQIVVEPTPAPNATANESVRTNRAGDAFREPQCPRVLFLGIVHGFKRRGAYSFHVPQMEKFVGCNFRQILVRRNRDCRRVRVLHPTTCSGRGLANVKNKCVVFERRAAHQFDFVPANARQVFFDLLLSPAIAVDDDGNSWRDIGQIELLEFPRFDGCIDKCVVRTRTRGASRLVKNRFALFE